MYVVIDTENNHIPIKSGFKTASQANTWCKKHLDIRQVSLWGKYEPSMIIKRYYVRMTTGR